MSNTPCCRACRVWVKEPTCHAGTTRHDTIRGSCPAASCIFMSCLVMLVSCDSSGHLYLSCGRTLVATVLSSQPVYYLSALNAPTADLEEIDKRRTHFLWMGADLNAGGKCNVAWPITCKPTVLGDLGILNLKKFARALRLQCLWQEWHKPWVGRGHANSMQPESVLFVLLCYDDHYIGNEETTSFWTSAWLQGRTPKDIAPYVYKISKHKIRRPKTP